VRLLPLNKHTIVRRVKEEVNNYREDGGVLILAEQDEKTEEPFIAVEVVQSSDGFINTGAKVIVPRASLNEINFCGEQFLFVENYQIAAIVLLD